MKSKARSLLVFLFTAFALTSYASAQTTPVGYLASENFQQIQLSDFTAHYLHKGQGEPVILLHGGGEWSYTYRKNIDILARRFSVYAVDLPGHGYTTPRNFDPRNLGFLAIRKFLSEFLASQHIQSATFIGHSWGGGFAIDYALAFPQRVRALVLLDSSGIDIPDHWEWEILKVPVLGRVAARLTSPFSTRYSLSHAFYDRSQVTAAMVDEVYGPLRSSYNKISLYYLSRNLKWGAVESQLAAIRQPTLIIWGAEDEFLPRQTGYDLQQRIPGSSLVIVNRAGHNVHEEQPEVVNRHILEFLKR